MGRPCGLGAKQIKAAKQIKEIKRAKQIKEWV